MSSKKEIRQKFRDSCLTRDKYTCVKCGYKSSKDNTDLEVHHITDRNLMPKGGYVLENGISLCPCCHWKAERFHVTGEPYIGYSVEDLYKAINSSYDKAIKASQEL